MTKNIKKLILKNRDRDVAVVYLVTKTKSNSKVIQYIDDIDIIDEKYLPLDMKKSNQVVANFIYWVNSRRAPNHRENSSQILNPNATIFDFLNISRALSLNDTFWIAPKSENLTWHECNLYKNNGSVGANY